MFYDFIVKVFYESFICRSQRISLAEAGCPIRHMYEEYIVMIKPDVFISFTKRTRGVCHKTCIIKLILRIWSYNLHKIENKKIWSWISKKIYVLYSMPFLVQIDFLNIEACDSKITDHSVKQFWIMLQKLLTLQSVLQRLKRNLSI